MPKKKTALTDKAIQNAKPAKSGGWREISDGAAHGLQLRVGPAGQKTWSLVVTVGGKRRRHALGKYPAVTLAEARKRAHEYTAAASEGQSPDAYERDRQAQRMNLRDAHAAYLDSVSSAMSPRWIGLKRGMFADHIDRRLGDKPIKQIRRADLIELSEAVAKDGHTTQANRVVSEVLACLRWAAERDWIESVPTVGKRTKQREAPRDRTLNDTELASLWKSLPLVSETVADFTALLILTGQRRDEIRLMHASEIDSAERVWTIPADRYKTGRTHTVPLSDAAWRIIKPRLAEDGYVFPSREGPHKPWTGTRNAMEQLRRHATGADTYTFHDIRRSVRTGLARLQVPVDVAEAVIGHAPQGILKVYDRHDRMEERRAALEAWARHVHSLAADNVVQFQRASA